MWDYYICKRKTLMRYGTVSEKYPNAAILESHCLNLDYLGDEGEVCAAIRFIQPEYQDSFELEPDVMPFPHVFHFAKTIGPELAAKIAAFGGLETHSTHEAMMILRKSFPALDPRFKAHHR